MEKTGALVSDYGTHAVVRSTTTWKQIKGESKPCKSNDFHTLTSLLHMARTRTTQTVISEQLLCYSTDTSDVRAHAPAASAHAVRKHYSVTSIFWRFPGARNHRDLFHASHSKRSAKPVE